MLLQSPLVISDSIAYLPSFPFPFHKVGSIPVTVNSPSPNPPSLVTNITSHSIRFTTTCIRRTSWQGSMATGRINGRTFACIR